MGIGLDTHVCTLLPAGNPREEGTKDHRERPAAQGLLFLVFCFWGGVFGRLRTALLAQHGSQLEFE